MQVKSFLHEGNPQNILCAKKVQKKQQPFDLFSQQKTFCVNSKFSTWRNPFKLTHYVIKKEKDQSINTTFRSNIKT